MARCPLSSWLISAGNCLCVRVGALLLGWHHTGSRRAQSQDFFIFKVCSKIYELWLGFLIWQILMLFWYSDRKIKCRRHKFEWTLCLIKSTLKHLYVYLCWKYAWYIHRWWKFQIPCLPVSFTICPTLSLCTDCFTHSQIAPLKVSWGEELKQDSDAFIFYPLDWALWARNKESELQLNLCLLLRCKVMKSWVTDDGR